MVARTINLSSFESNAGRMRADDLGKLIQIIDNHRDVIRLSDCRVKIKDNNNKHLKSENLELRDREQSEN